MFVKCRLLHQKTNGSHALSLATTQFESQHGLWRTGAAKPAGQTGTVGHKSITRNDTLWRYMRTRRHLHGNDQSARVKF